MRVTLIPGCNPGPYTGAGNNTWLLSGRQPALIDAATGEPGHLAALDAALAGAALSRVLVTHGHVDHAAGAPGLAARRPETAFFKAPWPERDGEYRVAWRPLAEGDLVDAGDGELRVLHTPGHAPDHVCFLDEEEGTLFCGDLLIQGGTVVVPGSYGGDLADYLASLARVRELRPARVLPAHGPEIDDVTALIDEYVAHRQPPRRRDPRGAAPGPHDAGGDREGGLSGSRPRSCTGRRRRACSPTCGSWKPRAPSGGTMWRGRRSERRASGVERAGRPIWRIRRATPIRSC